MYVCVYVYTYLMRVLLLKLTKLGFHLLFACPAELTVGGHGLHEVIHGH